MSKVVFYQEFHYTLQSLHYKVLTQLWVKYGQTQMLG